MILTLRLVVVLAVTALGAGAVQEPPSGEDETRRQMAADGEPPSVMAPAASDGLKGCRRRGNTSWRIFDLVDEQDPAGDLSRLEAVTAVVQGPLVDRGGPGYELRLGSGDGPVRVLKADGTLVAELGLTGSDEFGWAVLTVQQCS